jgi:N-acyl-D-aspartate/D-glutamate deacylase
MAYDLIIRGGTVVDGTGRDRFTGDVAVQDGRIAAIGEVSGVAAREIDAAGLIVAPGVIDLHTHYDAQLHWDPYCTASGWHGTTTVLIGNCGFGFAPVRPGMADRYMRMMENTEQVPYDCMARTMPWDWETFPQWFDHLRNLPKGLNVATYLPLNALLSYVVGPDEAKRRPASDAERAEMRRILNEAMDAGAAGFSFSHLGAQGNTHVDFDQTPMPTDIMDPAEAYNLADVLRERGEGIIQVLNELPGAYSRRWLSEALARRSDRPVLHNILVADSDHPEQHRSALKWVEEMRAQGLQIWLQGFTFPKPLEITPMHYNNWDSFPLFRKLSAAHSREEKLALVASPDYRADFQRLYDPDNAREWTGPLEIYVLVDAAGSQAFTPFEGRTVADIAQALGRNGGQCFLDILQDSEMDAMFVHPSAGSDVASVCELLNHPYVLAGTSDGGAHSKHGNGGFWSTEMIVRLARESGVLSLETLHNLLSARNAEAAGFKDRGVLTVGAFADLLIYDFDALNRTPELRYEVANDLPGGDWRKVKRAVGIRYIAVNGEVTFEDGVSTGATPGRMVADAVAPAPRHRAAAE